MENLAHYIIRASFSQERMTYIPANDAVDGTASSMVSVLVGAMFCSY